MSEFSDKTLYEAVEITDPDTGEQTVAPRATVVRKRDNRLDQSLKRNTLHTSSEQQEQAVKRHETGTRLWQLYERAQQRQRLTMNYNSEPMGGHFDDGSAEQSRRLASVEFNKLRKNVPHSLFEPVYRFCVMDELPYNEGASQRIMSIQMDRVRTGLDVIQSYWDNGR